MDFKNSFNIKKNSDEFKINTSYEKKEFKSPPLRATVFVVALYGSSLVFSQTNPTNQFDFSLPEEIKSVSLERTEELTNRISYYSCELKSFDRVERQKQLIRDILSFKALENSWDGFNAIPLNVDCALNAIQIIQSIDNESVRKITDIFPNPNGTVTLEWENRLDEIVSVEIGKNTFSCFVDFNSIETKFYNKQLINFENISLLQKNISAI